MKTDLIVIFNIDANIKHVCKTFVFFFCVRFADKMLDCDSLFFADFVNVIDDVTEEALENAPDALTYYDLARRDFCESKFKSYYLRMATEQVFTVCYFF